MFRFFSHMKKQFEFKKLFNDALSLSEAGSKQAAFDKFLPLLQIQPANPYLRHQILGLSEQLNKSVVLPELVVKTRITKSL